MRPSRCTNVPSPTASGGALGDTHPSTLASRNNLPDAYQAAGRLDEAIALYERTLADRERVLGDTHPSTLTSRNNLALAYQQAGRSRAVAQLTLDPPPPEAVLRSTDHRVVLFKEEIIEALRTVRPGAKLTRLQRAGDQVVDVLMTEPMGKGQGDAEIVVGVEIKLARKRLNTDTVRRAVQQSHTRELQGLVVVSSRGFTRGAKEAMRNEPVQLVEWSGKSDNPVLGEAFVVFMGPVRH